MNFEVVENLVMANKRALIMHNIDDTIPLDVRWNVFMNAPHYLKSHSCWIERFNGLPEDFIGYDEPVHAERHRRVDMDYIMDVISDVVDEDEYAIDVVAFKEDVLSRNLGSFEYAW